MSNSTGVLDPTLYFISERPLTPGFMILSSVIVFLMQVGFAKLETGVARVTSSQNVFMKNMLDSAITALCFFFIGFGLAYGEGPLVNPFVGSGAFALRDVHQSYAWFVQYSYVNNAATIFGGSLAGRTRFSPYIIMTMAIATFIFPIAAHWVWARTGWLGNIAGIGPIDFVGAGPVHLLGGTCGVVGALMVGPRIGFVPRNAQAKYRSSHNKLLSATGAFMLWMGWLAFTSVSSGRVTPTYQIDVVGRVATCTLLAASTGAVVSVALRRAMGLEYDIIWLANSSLVGLVAITAPCATIQPWAAIVIGAMASCALAGMSEAFIRCSIDDPLDSACVHITGSIIGLICAAFFSDPALMIQTIDPGTLTPATSGIFYGGTGMLLGLQLLEIVVMVVWGVSTSLPILYLLKRWGRLRVSKETEMGGVDLFKHNTAAFALASSRYRPYGAAADDRYGMGGRGDGDSGRDGDNDDGGSGDDDDEMGSSQHRRRYRGGARSRRMVTFAGMAEGGNGGGYDSGEGGGRSRSQRSRRHPAGLADGAATGSRRESADFAAVDIGAPVDTGNPFRQRPATTHAPAAAASPSSPAGQTAGANGQPIPAVAAAPSRAALNSAPSPPTPQEPAMPSADATTAANGPTHSAEGASAPPGSPPAGRHVAASEKAHHDRAASAAAHPPGSLMSRGSGGWSWRRMDAGEGPSWRPWAAAHAPTRSEQPRSLAVPVPSPAFSLAPLAGDGSQPLGGSEPDYSTPPQPHPLWSLFYRGPRSQPPPAHALATATGGTPSSGEGADAIPRQHAPDAPTTSARSTSPDAGASALPHARATGHSPAAGGTLMSAAVPPVQRPAAPAPPAERPPPPPDTMAYPYAPTDVRGVASGGSRWEEDGWDELYNPPPPQAPQGGASRGVSTSEVVEWQGPYATTHRQRPPIMHVEPMRGADSGLAHPGHPQHEPTPQWNRGASYERTSTPLRSALKRSSRPRSGGATAGGPANHLALAGMLDNESGSGASPGSSAASRADSRAHRRAPRHHRAARASGSAVGGDGDGYDTTDAQSDGGGYSGSERFGWAGRGGVSDAEGDSETDYTRSRGGSRAIDARRALAREPVGYGRYVPGPWGQGYAPYSGGPPPPWVPAPWYHPPAYSTHYGGSRVGYPWPPPPASGPWQWQPPQAPLGWGSQYYPPPRHGDGHWHEEGARWQRRRSWEGGAHSDVYSGDAAADAGTPEYDAGEVAPAVATGEGTPVATAAPTGGDVVESEGLQRGSADGREPQDGGAQGAGDASSNVRQAETGASAEAVAQPPGSAA